jgi:hypothetical protein
MTTTTAVSSRTIHALPDDDEAIARFIAWIRNCMAEGTAGRWSGTLPQELCPAQLHHLPPPTVHQGAGVDPRYTAWHAAYRPGLCYYRHGPGFLEVKDIRDPQAGARFTLDDPTLTGTFLRCLDPVRLSALTGETRQAAELLARERLLLRVGGYLTTAPYRMRRWPIPARLV